MTDKYLHSLKTVKHEREPSRYMLKVENLKQQIREYVHENAALCDEICEVHEQILIRMEERRFLLRKLCQFEPHTELEVEALSKMGFNQSNNANQSENRKTKKKASDLSDKPVKSRKSSNKVCKKLVQPIPLDSTGRPVFPIELGNLTVHSLGEVISERKEFHCEEAIYPVGYVSTRIYGSLKDPTIKCMYTCKISDANGLPRFEIASDDNEAPIVCGTPDVCHSLLLQRINDVLSLNVVSTRPRGNDFFGLTHPTILNLIQSSPGTRKCSSYKWSKFEVLKSSDQYLEDADSSLDYDSLQLSIDFCKYKMAPDVLQRPVYAIQSNENSSETGRNMRQSLARQNLKTSADVCLLPPQNFLEEGEETSTDNWPPRVECSPDRNQPSIFKRSPEEIREFTTDRLNKLVYVPRFK